MRGRPKLADSRGNQYRVRLNDEENEILNYVSEKVAKPKSEIFRVALLEYYNNLRLVEYRLDTEYDEIWGSQAFSLKRVDICPHCKAETLVDFEDECSVTTEERPMGVGITYVFSYEEICNSCKKSFMVVGYVSEYPVGALEHEKITISLPESDGGE